MSNFTLDVDKLSRDVKELCQGIRCKVKVTRNLHMVSGKPMLYSLKQHDVRIGAGNNASYEPAIEVKVNPNRVRKESDYQEIITAVTKIAINGI